MKIEDGKTSSDALSGCAPIEWVKSVMSDFTLAWKQTMIDVKDLVKEFFYGLQGIGQTAAEGFGWLWKKVTGAPVIRGAVNAVSFGIGLAKKGWDTFDACTKTLIRSTATTGAVCAIAAGGIWAIASIAGAIGSSWVASAAITISAGFLLRTFANGVRFIYNFNWNQTDREIENNYKQKLQTIAGMAGDTVGTAIGGATCGWLVGTAIGRFNPVLAAKIKIAMPEIWEEVREQFEVFLKGVSRIGAGIMVMDIYKNARRWIKKNANRIPGLSSKWEKIIKAWGEEGSKPWSFAKVVEDKIESISNPITRAFVENTVESFFDSCTESVFTISYAI